ncbi:MAG: C25 family cysteine peptidase [bacterium]
MLEIIKRYRQTISIFGFFFIVGMLCSASEQQVVIIPQHTLHIQSSEGSSLLAIDDYGQMNIPGKPALPSRIFSVAVPPGAIIEDVIIRSHSLEKMPGYHFVQPAGMVLPLMKLTERELSVFEKEYSDNYRAVYEKDEFWPGVLGSWLGEAGFRKYRLVDVQINPVQYNPITGEIICHHDIQIEVSFHLSERAEILSDYSPRMETLARRLILNYDDAQAWYPQVSTRKRGGFELVVITTEALRDSVSSLVKFEQDIKGKSVHVATIEEISSSIEGADLAQKIRYFLRERYLSSEWGIEDVLLVGHHSVLPMRKVSQSAGYGSPMTDFYYAELSERDDINWDSNQNGRYWDDSDKADYYAEVSIGRIPSSNPAVVAALCQKSINFELNQDPEFKNNALLLGSFYWEDTDNAELMEAIMKFPAVENWTSIRMYEKNSTVTSKYDCDFPLKQATVLEQWKNGKYALANLAGHGSYFGVYQMGFGSASFWTSTLCNQLSNEFPSIVVSAACSTSDTDYTNLGEVMMEKGAVGFVGATKVAYGSRPWTRPTDGSTQSLDYYFSTAVMSKEYTQGEALQFALAKNYQQNGWYYPKYEIAEWNLWGSPTLGLDIPISSKGKLSLDKEIYSVNDYLTVTVRDADLSPGVDTFVTATTLFGDTETIDLIPTETEGVFIGLIHLVESQAVANNDRLDVQHSDEITVSYIDMDDGVGGVNVEKTSVATVDGLAPEIFNVQVAHTTSETVELTWETSKPSICSIYYGIDDLISTEQTQAYEKNHSIVLSELTPCTYYYFIINAADSAGNRSTDDNEGKFYRFNTYDQEIFYYEPLNVDPGWTMEGLWEFGRPEGQGGKNGFPDPTAGFSGQNVYGYNLSGDYNNSQPAHSLTSTRIDCRHSMDVMIQFKRWLGVERNMYDKASFEVSNDGETFTKIWENPDIEITDTEWKTVQYDISHIADGKEDVYLRWVMGSTNRSNVFCGWNIDDITLVRSIPCAKPTPEPRATATPAPPDLPSTGIHLSMDDYTLKPGSDFNLVLTLRNGLAAPLTVHIFVALEVYGNFWFWPTWVSMEEGIAFVPEVTVPAATQLDASILRFVWPDVTGPAHGLFFYGLLLDSSTLDIVGHPTQICWEFL